MLERRNNSVTYYDRAHKANVCTICKLLIYITKTIATKSGLIQ